MEHLEQLRKRIEEIIHPSNIMIKVNGEIKGAGFFPAANGSSDNYEKAKKTILVLGQDQDREKGFKKSKREKGEEYTPTWRHMKILFEVAGIKMKDCFFTNCLLGVRNKDSKNTGKSPGFGDPIFVGQCAQLLKEEIEFFKPKIILCLGLIPFKFLGLLSKEVLIRSIGTDEFSELDKWKFQVIEEKSLFSHTIYVVVLCHPSYRKLNMKYRRYSNKEGDDAEVQLLKDVLISANL